MTLQGALVIVAALVGSGGVSGYFATRPAKSTREGALIDQYQERYDEQVKALKAQDERIEKQQKQISEISAQVDNMRRREITYRNYMYELIRHIEEKAGPPPPPLPEELYKV